MTDTFQGRKTSKVSRSTPFEKKKGADQPFATAPDSSDRTRKQLASEMDGHWFGAMPVEEFLKDYLEVAETSLPLPPLATNPFAHLPQGGVETTLYDPFIQVISPWVPSMQGVNTSRREDTTHKLKLKPDVTLYKKVGGAAVPDRTDFEKMELWIEFKTNSKGVAFHDPDPGQSLDLAISTGSFTPSTVDGINARGQLALYASTLHDRHFRNFSYSVVIEGNYARLLRWSHSGTVVSAKFSYHSHPQYLAEFLWRFDQLSPECRGYDPSVRPAQIEDKNDDHIRKKLNIKDKRTMMFEYDVPGLEGLGHAYGPRPPRQNQSIVSRRTHSLPVVWIPMPGDEKKNEIWSRERIVFMKDTWRFLSDSPDIKVLPEHEIYAELHKAKTPNIPSLVAGGDIVNGETMTHQLLNASWLCAKARPTRYQHYRLVLGTVGHALVTFQSTRELVSCTLDAIKAHWHAFRETGFLHRDISSENIIVTDDGKGMLIDWEMAKRLDDVPRRRDFRTGTWQFISANLLRHPGTAHTLTDDLESFLHVLGWMMLRYLPANQSYTASDRSADLSMFEEWHQTSIGGHESGGLHKSRSFVHYPSDAFQPEKDTPLVGLLYTLGLPFKTLYYPELRDDGRCSHPGHEKNQCLQSPSWFIKTIEDALAKKTWPTDDAADQNLPIHETYATRRQDAQLVAQAIEEAGRLEQSIGFPRPSKRRAASKSPTPGPSMKRRRPLPGDSGPEH